MHIIIWHIVFLVSILLRCIGVVGYVLHPAFLHKQQHSFWQYTVLHAKKIPTSSNDISKKNGFCSGGSTGGNSDLQGKLRSVSSTGRVGAGSKQLRQAAITFDRIRKEHGKDFSFDVYVRSPLNSTSTFWFVGKIAYEPSILPSSIADDDNNSNNDVDAAGVWACISQKRLILEYSMHHLRPQNMGGNYASALEIWLAPPDSEMDVAQNKVTLRPVVGSARSALPDHFKADSVGYNPEIYVGDEITQGGLRVQRDEHGKPVKPIFEVNQTV